MDLLKILKYGAIFGTVLLLFCLCMLVLMTKYLWSIFSFFKFDTSYINCRSIVYCSKPCAFVYLFTYVFTSLSLNNSIRTFRNYCSNFYVLIFYFLRKDYCCLSVFLRCFFVLLWGCSLILFWKKALIQMFFGGSG